MRTKFVWLIAFNNNLVLWLIAFNNNLVLWLIAFNNNLVLWLIAFNNNLHVSLAHHLYECKTVYFLPDTTWTKARTLFFNKNMLKSHIFMSFES